MATETEVLKLDLDSSSFISKVEQATHALHGLGEVDSIKGVISGFKDVVGVAAVAATAVYAFKGAIDLVKEAEEIAKIEAQFDAVAESAGLAAGVLRNELKAATHGLIDDTDALKVGAQSITMLGENAGKLPEIFEMAHRSVLMFGGTIEERVEQFSRAIATGQTRMLRSIGINIDMEKTLGNYAAALGLTTDALTEQQRKMAIGDAIMSKAQEKFKDVNADAIPLTTTIKQIGVIFAEMSEWVIKEFNTGFGPILVKMAQAFKAVAQEVNLFLKAHSSDEATRAEANVEKLRKKHDEMAETLRILQAEADKMAQGPLGTTPYALNVEKRIDALKEKMAGLSEQIKGEEAKIPAERREAAPSVGGITPEQRAQVESDRAALNLKMTEIDFQSAQDRNAGLAEIEQQKAAYIEAIEAESKARIDAIHAAGPGKVKNAADQELLIRKQTAAKIEQVNRDSFKRNARTYDEMVRTMNVGQGALTVGLVAGFKAIGKGGKEAAKAMKAAFLGMFADRAEAAGQLKIAEGIFPPNPGLLAAGAGLLALGGVLRGMAGDGGGASMPSAGGGGGGGGGGLGGGGGTTEAPTVQRPDVPVTPSRGRQVTVAIQGNYFETEQTRRALMEMIRQETDATAFSYTQISQGAV